MSPEELQVIIQADLNQRLPSPFEHRVEIVEPGKIKLGTRYAFEGQVVQVSYEEEYRLLEIPIVLADFITYYVSNVRYQVEKALGNRE